MTVEGLGVALGPVVGGALWEAFGPHIPFLVGGFIFLGLSLFYFYALALRRFTWN